MLRCRSIRITRAPAIRYGRTSCHCNISEKCVGRGGRANMPALRLFGVEFATTGVLRAGAFALSGDDFEEVGGTRAESGEAHAVILRAGLLVVSVRRLRGAVEGAGGSAVAHDGAAARVGGPSDRRP